MKSRSDLKNAEVGLELPQRGSHVLRHSFALNLLREGIGMKTIGVDEILAVLAAVDPKSPSGPRDLALLSLMFNTGARVSEMYSSEQPT